MGFHRKPTTFVSHVKIKVANLERSLKFYQGILGFSILNQTTSSAKLTADDMTNILTLVQPEGVKPKQSRTTGLYHFALLLPEKSDLANIVIHLSNNNIHFGAADHLVSEALYMQDPDGNEIEIYIDRDPAEWSWNGSEVSMTTDPLDFETLLRYSTPDKQWDRLPEKTLMGHIHLHVSDLRSTEEFYVKGLGFNVVNRYGGQALFLSTGKYHHHIGVNTWNGVGAPKPGENSVGMESYTLILPNEEALKDTVANLERIGASITVVDGQYFTCDPSGNRIELSF